MQVRHAAQLVCAAALAATGPAAYAQGGYPNHPIRMVVPSSAGGGTDIIARVIQPKLSEQLGQQVVIDNRPGAGTMIGIDMVAKAPGDGYTILMGLSTLATNPLIYKRVLYDAVRDFAPVTLAISAPNVMVVHPSVPAQNVKDLISLARAQPGKLNFGSSGLGTNPHLCMELFLSMTKLKMVHIPYKGSAPALIDMLAGQFEVMAATMLTGVTHVRSGRLRALGVTGSRRSAVMPEVPTIAEAGVPGYEAVQWYGVLAPAKTPKEIVTRLNTEIVRILKSPDVKQRLASDGVDVEADTPDEFARYIQSELVKWAKVAKDAGIKPE
jgi:tripartite-type tricarboxylate transporter receptor subunit TctC